MMELRHVQDVLQWSFSQIQLHPMAEATGLQKYCCAGELPQTPE